MKEKGTEVESPLHVTQLCKKAEMLSLALLHSCDLLSVQYILGSQVFIKKHIHTLVLPLAPPP